MYVAAAAPPRRARLSCLRAERCSAAILARGWTREAGPGSPAVLLLVGDDELGETRGDVLDDSACLLGIAGELARNLVARPMVEVLALDYGWCHGVLHKHRVAQTSLPARVFASGFTSWTHDAGR